MKCNNCKNVAFYIYRITDEYKQYFCKKHVPKFLEPIRKAGNLETTEGYAKSVAAAVESVKTYVEESDPVVETEAVVEETVVEEEQPKPRKKSKPKAELAEDEVNS